MGYTFQRVLAKLRIVRLGEHLQSQTRILSGDSGQGICAFSLERREVSPLNKTLETDRGCSENRIHRDWVANQSKLESYVLVQIVPM